MVEFTYNNKENASIEYMLFELNDKYYLMFFIKKTLITTRDLKTVNELA